MPPSYEKPCVKRNKTDAADTAAVCEALTRPSMRFVPATPPQARANAVRGQNRPAHSVLFSNGFFLLRVGKPAHRSPDALVPRGQRYPF